MNARRPIFHKAKDDRNDAETDHGRPDRAHGQCVHDGDVLGNRRRIVEFEQGGEKRAGYGEELLARLAVDLTARFGRGFSVQNLENMRLFYGVCGPNEISQTLSRKSALALPVAGEVQKSQTPSGKWQTTSAKSSPFDLSDLARAFPLPWSHYVLLIRRSRSPEAFAFYHTEALRGGWSVRQLQRQIDSQFYEPRQLWPACAANSKYSKRTN